MRQTLAALGAAAFMVVCCLVMPMLVAAGVLGAVGAFLRSPLVLVVGLAVAAIALTSLARRHSARSVCDPPADRATLDGE